MHKHPYTQMAVSALLAIFMTAAAGVHAEDHRGLDNPGLSGEPVLLLVQQVQQDTEAGNTTTPPAGTLLLPDSMTQTGQTGKKCMTVCASWGEECTYVNRGTGGTTRSCRRTCQQFTEECF
jgi:hypothetical protein